MGTGDSGESDKKSSQGLPLTVFYMVLTCLGLWVVGIGWHRWFSEASNLVTEEIVSVQTSPDRRFDAILYTTDGGATTSTGYHIAVVRHGNSQTTPETVYSSDGTIAYFWKGQSLDIHAVGGTSYHVQNQAIVDGVKIPILYDGYKMNRNDLPRTDH